MLELVESACVARVRIFAVLIPKILSPLLDVFALGTIVARRQLALALGEVSAECHSRHFCRTPVIFAAFKALGKRQIFVSRLRSRYLWR